jgi:hypothetical protein
MGFVSMATLLVVQDSLGASDLGVATASHQFSRTLGGTIGVGISGSFVTAGLATTMEPFMSSESGTLSLSSSHNVMQNIEKLFRPEVQALLSPDVQKAMQDAVARGVFIVFWVTLIVSLLCLFFSFMLPKQHDPQSKASY